ncbi:sensor histidine kinase [Streptomyces pinistramenti]|uniref:sensor histidine kinase n=1 Tax=Streptomyces pinistramenti TaxID=2884812 RepID=UPI001D094667|nr:HAMP domain-containing sensor histidine kinase [Streptomyces pinistramenti]MCB5906509.1 HAMP domain-containing histidine kinase [Streptomyces pinistramenti]
MGPDTSRPDGDEASKSRRAAPRWRFTPKPLRREVPLRRSLLLRLLAVSVVVSVCSVAATAYVVVQMTAVAIRQEQGQALADDAKAYDALLGYAARHPDWSDVTGTVAALARRTGHRIVLTSRGHPQPVADSDPEPGVPFRPPAKPTAVIDPLSVNPDLLPRSASDRIDPRAAGPFLLPRGERDRLDIVASRVQACLREVGQEDVRIEREPSGRSRLVLPPGASTTVRCAITALDDPTPTEKKALSALSTLVNTCLAHRGAPAVTLSLDGRGRPVVAGRETGRTQVSSCVATSRAEQLAPYVAPAAQLYVSSPGRAATTFFALSPANKARIAGGAALVLLVTVAVTVLAGIRLVRPLRALTAAVQRLAEGDASAQVRVTGGDEIGRLSVAFNSMAGRRAELERLRKAMVSDVAHELRTPLSNIRGWLEAAEDGVVDNDADLLASVLEEALLLQHIIDDLRDLAAADAGELRLSKVPVQVADVLAQTANAHRADADASGVTLTVTADDETLIDADPVRLRQMTGNLVSNAIRHTPRGGTVTLHSRAADGTVRIDVADTGAGIAPDELPHVFDRFWRAEKSRSRQTGGSGLGLSIVRKLAETHGGTVTARSAPGAGSVFRLTLPLPPQPGDDG